MKLYGANVCPFVHRVRLVLAEKDLEHEYVNIDLRNKPDWYHDVLPTGRVPLMEHNGARIWESNILCEYLEEAFPEHRLTPTEPAQRAKMRLFIEWTGSKFIPTWYKLLSAQDSETVSAQKAKFEEVFKELEAHLSETDGPFVLGEMSLADLELYPWFERWPVLEHYRAFQKPGGLPKVAAWTEKMSSLPSVTKIVEESSYFIEQYRDYAVGTKVPS